jgi:hypothetical protein
MSIAKNKKCKGKHFTWFKPMSHMLLKILVEEALKGNKPSSTFKAESFVKVTIEISQSSMCNASLSMWTIISKL